MTSNLLHIEGLKARIEDKEILRGLNLTVKPGQIHAIMGPNGAGKSTLSKVLAGHPSYEVIEGTISMEGEDILELQPHERALAGLFISFQYPLEVGGISNQDFLFAAYKAHLAKKGEIPTLEQFEETLKNIMAKLSMREEFLQRGLNTGFSGGEKKRNEILQMFLLNPKVAILDETDSGLDVDALKIIAASIKAYSTPNNGIVLITHYQRLLDLVEPDVVHIMVDGQIVLSGDKTLASQIEKYGYESLLVTNG